MAHSVSRLSPQLPRLRPAVTQIDGGVQNCLSATERRRREMTAARHFRLLQAGVLAACAVAVTTVAVVLVLRILQQNSCQNQLNSTAAPLVL
jgi:hypothetical protein